MQMLFQTTLGPPKLWDGARSILNISALHVDHMYLMGLVLWTWGHLPYVLSSADTPIGAFNPWGTCGQHHGGAHEGKTKQTSELRIIIPSPWLFHIKQLISVPSCEDTGKHAFVHTWTPYDLDTELSRMVLASL